MKPKKNTKADLNKSIGLYFAIGMASVLLLIWMSFEWKSYDKKVEQTLAMEVDNVVDEEVPITELNTPPPPPPPPPPAPTEIIQVVENTSTIVETKIASTESSKNEQIVKVSDIRVVEEEPEEVEVPFAVIEDVPLFPGCEKFKDNQQKAKACFQEKMNDHVRKYFRYPEIAQEMGVQGRVNVIFTIDKDGSISNIRTKGPDKTLEEEANRIISKLPSMSPGKQRGKAVKVPFSIPIVFRLE